MKFLPFYICFIINIAHLVSEEINVSQPLRIDDFIPRKNLFCVLAVEPALPEDFVSYSETNTLDYLKFLYWGKKEVITAYMNDPNTLSEPIIGATLPVNFSQTNLYELDVEKIKDQFPPDYKITILQTGKWGQYPYCTFTLDRGKQSELVAYVGFNHESGAVLLLNLLNPKTPAGKKKGFEIWDNFFKNTKQLPFPLFVKAQGQELHIGYTHVQILDKKIKVIAERRKSDKKVQVGVIPLDPSVEFKFQSAELCQMGQKWHHGEPLAKIKGTYVLTKDSVSMTKVISILLKEVEEFSSIPPQKNLFLKSWEDN